MTVTLFTSAGLAILIGLCGLAAAKCQKCLCTFFYNLAVLLMVLLMIAIAMPILTMYFMTPEDISSFCKGELKVNSAF